MATRYYEDVKPGDELPTVKKAPIARRQIVKYAAASGDYNLIHIDEPFAVAAGLGSTIAHGMLSMGISSNYAVDWYGDDVVLKAYKVRFAAMVKPGDELTLKGKVTDKYIKNGEGIVECEVTMENQRGERTLIGKAVGALPTKE